MSAKLSLTIHCGKDMEPSRVGEYVVWAELDGLDITGPLAHATDRDVAIQRGRLELAQRLTRALHRT